MAQGRLVRQEEADELLAAWERSGERMSEWCTTRGLNWYSLCGYKRRRTQQSKEVTFAEVVTCAAVQTAATPAVYRVYVGEVTIEVEDDFTDATLVRLVRAVAQC